MGELTVVCFPVQTADEHLAMKIVMISLYTPQIDANRKRAIARRAMVEEKDVLGQGTVEGKFFDTSKLEVMALQMKCRPFVGDSG